MIYIAGPFFTPEERENLEEMISWVKEKFYDEALFIPMEHFIPDGETLPNSTWAKKVFDMDVKALESSKQVIALYLGHYSDTGTAWEIGYAYAKNIPITLYIPEKYRNLDMSIMPINSAYTTCNKFKLNQK